MPEADDQDRIDTQTWVLNNAMELALPDAVLYIVSYNHWRRPSDPINLDALLAKGSRDDLGLWQSKALKALKDAYDMGDALLRRDGSYPQARAKFEAKHPGFGKVGYDEALSWGCHQAR